jgi:hypothetical protein
MVGGKAVWRHGIWLGGGTSLESGWCIHPQKNRLLGGWITPATRLGTGEVEAISYPKTVILHFIQPYL